MTSIVEAIDRYTSDEVRKERNPDSMGGMSETKIIEFEDGTKFVVKIVNNESDTINEYLSHLVAKLMGIPVPDFIRADYYTMIMSFIPGKTAVDISWNEMDEWITPEIRLFDRVIRNIDRNCANIIKHAETGVVFAIDHALAMPEYGRCYGESGTAHEVYSPDEVARITTGLYALREVFIDEGRSTCFDRMMDRWHKLCDADHNY